MDVEGEANSRVGRDNRYAVAWLDSSLNERVR